MEVPAELIEILAVAERPLLLGHVNPDIDALGSMLALGMAMPASDVAISLTDSPVNQKLRFLRELGSAIPVADAARVALADVVVCLDTASPKRVAVVGGWESVAEKPLVNIDHHITNTDYGRFNWVIDNASSTSEVVHRLIAAAGWPLSPAGATLLFAGMYADTGGFSLPTARAETFETAGCLIRAGANVEQVGVRLCRSQEPHEFDLIRAVYHHTHLAAGGRIAYSTLTHAQITEAGCTSQDIDDQVSIPRSLLGVRIAILFSEGEPGVVRINLRGEEGMAVLPLAERFGGGGHVHSAGVRMRGRMDEVVQRVLTEAERCLDQQG